MTLTINGDMSKKEANLYVQQLKEKNPDKYFKTVDITVDGEYVDVNYTYDEVPFERIRRITGYLVGTVDRFNDAKRAEVNDRVKHSLTNTEIKWDNFKEKIWPLDAAELLYVGRATENKLAQYGIRTIGDLAKTSPDTLRHMLGINGLMLWMYANGTDTSRVMHKDFVSPVKSIGHGITCTADLQTPEDVFRVMLELSQDVGHRLRVHELMACGVQVSVRTNDLYGSQYQCKLPFRTQLPNEIAGAGFHLLMERYRWDKPIRAVTIRGIDLVSQKEAEQLSMFVDHQKRDRRILLEDAVEDIRRRFGKRAISYAILMGDLKIPDDDRQLVTMPGLMYQ